MNIVGVCGVAMQAQPREFAQWPRQCMQLTLFIDSNQLRGMAPSEFRSTADLACLKISRHSGLQIRLVQDRESADIELRGESMRGGVLAFAFFPGGRCGEQLATRFNARVTWTRDLFLDTLVHELGHCFGLPHTNDRRDIMFPSMITGRKLDGEFGPYYSKPEMLRRYGPPPSVPVPPTPGVPVLIEILLKILTMIPASAWEAIIKAIIDAISKNPAAAAEAVQAGLAMALVDARGPTLAG